MKRCTIPSTPVISTLKTWSDQLLECVTISPLGEEEMCQTDSIVRWRVIPKFGLEIRDYDRTCTEHNHCSSPDLLLRFGSL